jgi:PAS domain-containing protein
MSPIHLQYLRNMGVAATLVLSVMVGGRLWGLIACHHYAPRFIHFGTRAMCEVLAEALATRIAALDGFAQGQAELAVRRLEHRMSEAIRREGDWRIALFDGSPSLLQPVGASGAALLFEGQTLTAGDVPGTPQLRDLAAWLDRRQRWPVFETASLSLDAPEFAPLAPLASGLLATRVSNSPGEYLMWFRPEVVTTVVWAGDPFKREPGDTAADLSPRRSFAQWHQQVEGTAEKWSPGDLAAARLIGESVTDVVLQFRAVRMLIAQDQLEQVVRQVRISAQPVIVADAEGRVLLRNEAFARLLPAGAAPIGSLDDLPALFGDRLAVTQRLRDMRGQRRDWRGEVLLAAGPAPPRPMLMRGDVVATSPERVLGFVLTFTDLTERHAADAARQRFQEGISRSQRIAPERVDPGSAVLLQTLLGSVTENAQLAALEITDGMEPARMPAMLESVQASVSRAAGLLRDLLRHRPDPGAGG